MPSENEGIVCFFFNNEVYEWMPKHSTNPSCNFEFIVSRYPFIKAKPRNSNSDHEFYIRTSEIHVFWIESDVRLATPEKNKEGKFE